MATAQRLQLHNPPQGLSVLPTLHTIDFNDNTFFAVYCFIKNFIGTAIGNSSSAREEASVTSCASAIIDTKIEHAMDGIKRHIIYTMRKEVEELNDHIVYLLERIRQLENENQFLKSKASPEVLRELNRRVITYPQIEDGEEMHSEDLEVAAIITNAQQQQQQQQQPTI